MKLMDMNTFQIACFVFQAINKKVPTVFNNYFSKNADIHNHNTKHCLDSHQLRCKTNIRASCIKICGAKVWNSIPECIRKVHSIHIFKNTFKKFLQRSERLDIWLRHQLYFLIFTFLHHPTNLLTSIGDYGSLTVTPSFCTFTLYIRFTLLL